MFSKTLGVVVWLSPPVGSGVKGAGLTIAKGKGGGGGANATERRRQQKQTQEALSRVRVRRVPVELVQQPGEYGLQVLLQDALRVVRVPEIEVRQAHDVQRLHLRTPGRG